MNIQTTDSFRQDLLVKLANHINTNDDVFMILSNDSSRTTADNDSILIRIGISSIYNSSNILPKYIKKVPKALIKYGGLKVFGPLTGGTDVTYNNVTYSVVDYDGLANNKNKGLNTIYMEFPFSVANPEVYNVVTFVTSSGLTTDLDFTQSSPPSVPTLSADTVIVGQLRPASVFLPAASAPTENKTVKLLLRL